MKNLNSSRLELEAWRRFSKTVLWNASPPSSQSYAFPNSIFISCPTTSSLFSEQKSLVSVARSQLLGSKEHIAWLPLWGMFQQDADVLTQKVYIFPGSTHPGRGRGQDVCQEVCGLGCVQARTCAHKDVGVHTCRASFHGDFHNTHLLRISYSNSPQDH